MSFVHHVRVGFFGSPGEKGPPRQLDPQECEVLLRRYNTLVPAELQLVPETPPHGTMNRGIVLASAEGFPLVLKNGVLTCPYLVTGYIASVIGFVAYLHVALGCSIYEDEGKFLTLEEFIPRQSFASVMQEVLKQQESDQARTA